MSRLATNVDAQQEQRQPRFISSSRYVRVINSRSFNAPDDTIQEAREKIAHQKILDLYSDQIYLVIDRSVVGIEALQQMKVFGVDGFRHGWVAVWIDGKTTGIEFLENFIQLTTFSFSLAMVDIPIGLPQVGDRNCDLEARVLLGKGWPRVFTGARRGLLRFGPRQYDAANRWGKARGAGVSRQLFCLLPKIEQVDSTVRKRLKSKIREAHPELVFMRLNRWRYLPNKKTKEGRGIRRRLIKAAGFSKIDDWLDRRRLGTGAQPDDILDACACAIVARNPKRRVPQAEAQIDEKGLSMEIWY